MKLLTYAVPLGLALLLALATKLLISNPERLSLPPCELTDPICTLTKDVLRDISALRFDLERRQFSKQELPILSIYLNDGALTKLYKKRRDTLDKPGQILIIGQDDWVDATLIADDGNRVDKVKTQLRLKGDWSDHIKHPSKLSFRIKVQQQGYVFGMRRFSIQHPMTREFQAEPLFLTEMQRQGILAPRYKFVAVQINDYRIGVMALEEHYSKELLEAQRRRDGPILALDEDPFWQQKNLNMQVNPGAAKNLPYQQVASRVNDLAVKQFRQPSYVPGTSATHNAIRAQSLLRDYVDGKLIATDVFDLQQLAKWWVLTNVWNGCHGARIHNLRFYFNTTSNLLEPISFDNLPRPAAYAPEAGECDGWGTPNLQDNPVFQEHVLSFAEQLLRDYQDPAWQTQFVSRQRAFINILAIENFPTPVLYVKDLLRNLGTFIAGLHFQPISRSVTDSTHTFAQHYPDAPLHSHLRAFLYPEGEAMNLQLKNLGSSPVQEIQIEIQDASGVHLAPNAPTTLLDYQVNHQRHIREVAISRPYTAATAISVGYRYHDEYYKTTATVQHRGHRTGFSVDYRQWVASNQDISVDQGADNVVLQGQVTLDHSLELPRGWSLTVLPGTQLTLTNGAVLKIRGRLLIKGTAEEPVNIQIEANPDYEGMGAWGGILVVQSERDSLVEHATLRGAGDVNLPNRQDFYGLTGCLSFYESDVTMTHSSLENMHCEDALNIVRSHFILNSISIEGARADGFDADFSNGTIEGAIFNNIGNDAVDVSGTLLNIRHSQFAKIGDKAVSVGEKSELQASNLAINGAGSGVASKDLSRAYVANSQFHNIRGSALITYVKKQEYGFASINCEGII